MLLNPFAPFVAPTPLTRPLGSGVDILEINMKRGFTGADVKLTLLLTPQVYGRFAARKDPSSNAGSINNTRRNPLKLFVTEPILIPSWSATFVAHVLWFGTVLELVT